MKEMLKKLQLLLDNLRVSAELPAYALSGWDNIDRAHIVNYYDYYKYRPNNYIVENYSQQHCLLSLNCRLIA